METELLKALLSPEPSASLGFGFLTLDQGRRLLCLLQNESLAQEVPLVGVWVDLRQEESALPNLAASPSVRAAALHYIDRRQVREKVWVEKSTFLVVGVVRPRSAPPSSTAALLFSEFRFEDVANEASLREPGLGQETLVEAGDPVGGGPRSPEIRRSPALPHQTPPRPCQDLEADAPEGSMPSRSLGTILQSRPEEPRSQPRPVAEECRVCGASFVAEAAFCSRCGQRRPVPSPPAAPPQTYLWVAPGSGRSGKEGTCTSAKEPSTPSSRRSDETDGVSLRQVVRQQQEQLGLLQSQLQSVQQLLTHLVAKESQTQGGDAMACQAIPQADAKVQAAVEVQTSPRLASTGLQASVPMKDAAVNAVTSPKSERPERPKSVEPMAPAMPSIRDSADTAGGGSPRCVADIQAPAMAPAIGLASSWTPNLAGVPRIICPSDLSFSDDECDGLSDCSIDLMAGEFVLPTLGRN